MAPIDTAVYALHLAFAGVWAGGVLFVTLGVLPTARDGDIRPAPIARIVGRLRTISRASALVLLATGGHMAAAAYTAESLVGSTNGRLVLAMVALWVALGALVEVGSSRLEDGLERDKVRTPAADAGRLFWAASAVSVGLLLVGGVLAAT